MLRLSVDVGGTFTDLVLIDVARDTIWMEKVSSTPGTGAGVMDGIRRIIEKANVALADIDLFFHGSTVATNAWLTRSGADVVLIVTEGFRDILEIGDQRRPEAYSLVARKPEPLIRRSRVCEVHERLDASGDIVVALTNEELDRVVMDVIGRRPEAVAVSLLFSFVNPIHEIQLGERLKAALPDIPIYLSSGVNPQIKEYARTNTTVAAAYVGPPVAEYTTSLEASTAKAGLDARLVYMRSDGGAATPDNARSNPLNMLMSGPAGGVIGSLEIARHFGIDNIITFDMGGTSSDMAMIRNQAALVERSRIIDGLPVSIPMLDIKAISAGGGSVGHVDHAGGLHVGPHSAGAVPGPACYGRGGDKPTLTDAALALGYLDQKAFADADLQLCNRAAMEAIERDIARPLGLSCEDAALGMIAVATAGMSEAMRSLSVERGYDPADFALVAFGGAGGIFAPFLLRDLGINQLILPPNPGVFAALGLQHGDIRHSRQLPFLRPLSEINGQTMARAFSVLIHELRALLDGDGVAPARQNLIYWADMRYIGQYHELSILLTPEDMKGNSALADLRLRFIAMHEEVYGYSDAHGAVEIVNVRLDAIGEIDKPTFARPKAAVNDSTAPSSRQLYLELGGGWCEAPVFRRSSIPVGAAIDGPAVIEQPDTTLLVGPGQRASIDKYDFITVRPT